MLQTIPSPYRGVRQRHVLPIPSLCPRTENPASGSTVSIAYTGEDMLLDILTLPRYVASFVGAQSTRDLEQFVAVVARDTAAALGVAVLVKGTFVLHDGQILESAVAHDPTG